MMAVLGLVLSLLVTAALIGWLVAEAERPVPKRGRPGWTGSRDPSSIGARSRD